MNKIRNRVLLSLDRKCPYQCKHCYTFELPTAPLRSIQEIVDSIAGENFDIVYISQKTENFVYPNEGFDLCEQIFDKYKCSIMLITRNVFSDEDIARLVSLYEKMRKSGKTIFVGCSVIGLESARVSERIDLIPTPSERLDFIKKLYDMGLPALLLIRPLFPDKVIPNAEVERVVDYVAGHISCIVTGPLMVNNHILNRLSIQHDELSYIVGGESEYLNGAIAESMEFIDVSSETNHLRDYCEKKHIPFFTHSMPAINYINNMLY